ncbi:MAG TPA: Spy/CpxP family protein refolding chaperone [Caulobacteraceae bacterium]
MNPHRPLGLCALAAAALAAFAPGARAQVHNLADLHAALHLTAAEEAPWRAFAAANAPDPSDEPRHRAAEMLAANLPAPRRVDLAIAVMQADLTSLEARGASIKAFYAALTPAQQAIFDRETAPRGESAAALAKPAK